MVPYRNNFLVVCIRIIFFHDIYSLHLPTNIFFFILFFMIYTSPTYPQIYFFVGDNVFLRWGTHLYISLFLSDHLSFCLSVAHHISVIVHHVTIIFDISMPFYNIFLILFFFGWLGARLKDKGQKIAQNEIKNCICHTSYLRNSVAYDHMTMGFVILPQNNDMSWCFVFIFSKFWFSSC